MLVKKGRKMELESIIASEGVDFEAIFKCQFCSHTREGSGCDDEEFHKNIIPRMLCPNCGKTGNGIDFRKPNLKRYR